MGYRSTSVGTETTNLPAGVQAGDLLIALICSNGTGYTYTMPSGWTALLNNASGIGIFTKTATASEPASYTMTHSPIGGSTELTIVAYSNTRGVEASAALWTIGALSIQAPRLSAAYGIETYVAAFGGAQGPTLAASGMTTEYNTYSEGTFDLIADKVLTATGNTPPASATYTTTNGAMCVAASLLLLPNIAPAAPTLTGPANSASLDATGGVIFGGIYNSLDASNQSAYALRIKVSGAGSYSYWNAATSALQSTIVWNAVTTTPGQPFTITLPATVVPNGSTYNWSMASQNAAPSLQGAFATDYTFTAEDGPTVTVDGPSGDVTSPTPTLTWTTTCASGSVQTYYRVVVYTAAQYSAAGFAPGEGANAWDSTKTPGPVGTVVTGALPNNTTCRAYVQATETGDVDSAWSYIQFPVAYDTPAAPTLTATPGVQASPSGVPYPGGGIYPQGVIDYPVVTLTINGHDNLLPADDASLEGGIGTWASAANATLARSSAWSADGTYSLAVTATTAATCTVQADPVTVTEGSTYTAWAVLRAAATARAVTLTLSWLNSSGTQLSTTTFTGTDSPSANLTLSGQAVAPTGAVTVRTELTITSPAASEVHYADQVGLFPGTVTAWTRGGLAGIGHAYVTYDLNGATATVATTKDGVLLPAPDQTVTVVDAEVIPGTSRSYSAYVTVDV